MAEPAKERAGDRKSFWRELPLLFVVALVLALLIKAFAIQAFRIPSGSMEDTLRIGDRVLVNKVVYDLRGIDRGDIVVFNGQGSWDPPVPPDPGENPFARAYHGVLRTIGLETDGTDYIKRVIGLPGDHVACCDAQGRLTVNGIALHEGSYLYPGSDPSAQKFRIVVPPGRLWVMGDHRADSADSRYHLQDPGDGTIPINEVVGRAFIVIWPPSQFQALPIPKTFRQAALDGAGAVAPAVPLLGGFALALPLVCIRRKFLRRSRARS
ncbi:MAG: signal peptidase I [Micromonosporaceae bacterium]